MAAPSIARRDPPDPAARAVEHAQRGRMVLDVAGVDHRVAEEAFGPAHPTTLYFRHALDDARRAWDRLRARYGGAALEEALARDPVVSLALAPAVDLIWIGGRTYRAERVEGTDLAPLQWRLTRLHPPLEHGPYYACRLRDGSFQCDCAEWLYREDAPTAPDPCKHLAALGSMGWL